MAETFSREELYKLVWTKPITHLAKQFGLSDVAIHKVCRRHNIPTPPLGWWAKNYAGKQVRVTPLPKAEKGYTKQITMTASNYVSQEPPLVTIARQKARIVAATTSINASDKTHPALRRSIVELRKKRSLGEHGLAHCSGEGMITCSVSPDQVERLEKIVPAILAAAEVQGFSLETNKTGSSFRAGEYSIGFAIREALDSAPHIPTEKEMKRVARWERQRREWNPRLTFLPEPGPRPTIPEFNYMTTGKLSLDLNTAGMQGVARSTFRDTRTRRLENMAADVAVGLAVAVAADTAHRLKVEEQNARHEAERLSKIAKQRAEFVAERRAAEIASVLGRVQEIEHARRILAALPEHPDTQQFPRVAEFKSWLSAMVREFEGESVEATLERRFSAANIFGQQDDEKFLPKWY